MGDRRLLPDIKLVEVATSVVDSHLLLVRPTPPEALSA
jgi:hypothetical protein